MGLGQSGRALQELIRAQDIARATANPAMVVFYGANAAWWQIMRGDLKKAAEELSELLRLSDEIGSAVAGGRMVAAYQAGLARYLGEGRPAFERLKSSHALASEVNDTNVVWVTSHWLAELALELNDEFDAAKSALLRALELSYGFDAWPLSYLARVHAREGDLESAKAKLEEAQAFHRAEGAVFEEIFLSLAAAEIARQESRLGDATEAYRQAAEIASQCEARWYRAYALGEQAEMLIAVSKAARVDEPRRLLEQARSEFAAMGAPIYAERIEARLRELEAGADSGSR
jgi:tetratricopeptide (TPR) repeat protein